MSSTSATPQFNCSRQATGGIQPKANNQSGNCTNGVTYLQGFTGVPGYPSGQKVTRFNAAPPYSFNGGLWSQVSPFSTSNTYAWVEYYWCPSNALGTGSINYSKINIGPTTSQCIDFYTGGGGGDGSDTYGAALKQGSGPNWYGDGEAHQAWHICQGNYVWDYSTIQDGSPGHTYYAYFRTVAPPQGDGLVSVHTPVAQ